MLDEFMIQKLQEITGVTVEHETTFKDLTTLRIGGSPRATVHCETAEAAVAALRVLEEVPYLVVGGGSNLVVAEGELEQVVVRLDFDDIDVSVASGLVRADAGATWDDVVSMTVECGLGGIECLSGIPGDAGAVPVQNVGAYGAEISDVLTQVYLYDRATGEASWVPAAALELAYRYSNLKFTGRGVVLAIELQLTTDGLSKPLRFGQLTQTPGERRPAAEVREQVLSLRRSKGMVLDDADHDTWSAGSFFTNPIVDSAVADRIQEIVRTERGAEDADRMPRHAVHAGSDGEEIKLSAAWLIERAGFAKGYPGAGPATLSTKHTLALTNRGTATAADVVALAREIRAGVAKRFGVELVPEPVWIGVSI
ncbi:UDP-N-acetylenolpyruvoylglucosamine reductase [Corynebacterium sp. HMSC05D08]|uniref:UDP-N-acetylmuramate dehydrogenase n=1 Tax=Corynebacterium sp. HMSC05D08 TaxID=1581116 RepID=UPI0008A283C1|nr:UDP-N-acetylmuramate dehydrogenase [Corynebacterium sp. HMSC05D08]OFT60868.1 UDP-N-acetylenolpyruvoylglucosamine reductase [Corynebacterium sp. HMSC05D08]